MRKPNSPAILVLLMLLCLALASCSTSAPADSSLRKQENIASYDGCRPFQSAPTGFGANSMGYALECGRFIGDHDLGIMESELQGCTTAEMLSHIKDKIESWMNTYLGASNYSQIADYYSDIDDDCFRVVLRVGFVDGNNNGVYDRNELYDYHWMYETNEFDGGWAVKYGAKASKRIPGSRYDDPALYLDWQSEDIVYDSAPVYYSVKNVRTVSW